MSEHGVGILNTLHAAYEGRLIELGTDLSAEMPHGPTATFHPFSITQYRTPRSLADPTHTSFDFSMDVIHGSPHLGSHIDAFVHVQAEGQVHGGVSVQEAFGDFGWSVHGAHTIPPLVTRGVFLDIARHNGFDCLPDGFEITVEHLQDSLTKAQVVLQVGDVLLFRTGKMRDYRENPDAYFAAGPGLGVEAAEWLADSGVVAIGSDTTATEPVPFRNPDRTTHRAMLVDRGVYLLEILDLDELARAEASTCLFICLPLRFVGATGSWVRPIAIV